MLGFLKDIAAAARARGMKELLEFVPGGKYLYEIGADALKRRKERQEKQKLEDEVKEMVAGKVDAALAARQAVEEVAADLPPREKHLLTQFLAGVPEAARQSLKRKDDPSGRSVPNGFSVQYPDDVAKLLPQSPPRFVPGDTVPGLSSWGLVRRLGGGGFGEVWLAQHSWDGDEPPAAFKFCTDPASRHRLVTHEKDLIVRVMRSGGKHRNIVRLLECNLDGVTPWLKYEYVPGGTLAELISASRGLAPVARRDRAVGVLHTLAAAVGHFHAMTPPIVHRDLKPANVLMQVTDGSNVPIPRITDFGIGGLAVALQLEEEKTRGAASMLGRLPTMLSGSYSLIYASPQQRNGADPDPRDDVHALGVIAYQMLVGQLDADVKGNWQKKLRTDGVPDPLIELIGESVSDEPEDRPATAGVLLRALAAQFPVPLAQPEAPAEPSPPVRPAVPPVVRPSVDAPPIPLVSDDAIRPARQSAPPPAPPPTPPTARQDTPAADPVVRIIDLSAQWGVPPLTLLGFAQELGYSAVKSRADKLTPEQVEALRQQVKKAATNRATAPPPPVVAARPAPPPPRAVVPPPPAPPPAVVPPPPPPPAATAPVLLREYTIPLRGTWFSRPTAGSAPKWAPVKATPAVVGVHTGEEYQFHAHLSTTDESLDGLTALADVKSVVYLDLTHTRVTDAGLATVGKLVHLRKLGLEGCEGITDAGLAHLKGLIRLEELELSRTFVTSEGVDPLRRLPLLKKIGLQFCSRLHAKKKT